MQVDLYQTLKSINVTDDQAKLVVASIEEYIDDMVGDATKPLQEKIDGLQRSLETHMKTQTWVISIIGFTIVALTAIGTLVAPPLPPPYRGGGRQPDGRKEVIYIDPATIVALVLGTATLVVAIISLVVKIIELTRH